MNKKIHIFLGLAFVCVLTACNDWLDVKSEVEEKETDLFSTYEGFRSALTGCYMAMSDRDIYGERLTMTDIESLASLWDKSKTGNLPATYYLSEHDYESDYTKASLKAMYGGLFNVITQANMVIAHIATQGEVISDPATRAVVEGEAYALRAYCQMDLLRMFGQLPVGATKEVELPYSYTTELEIMPSYFSFAEYVKNLESDLQKAESLLKENDPICRYTFDEISYHVSDDFLHYRQFRLNYWAVKALQTRLALYLDEKDKAYNLAMEIIREKRDDGEVKFNLSGSSDLALGTDCFACPSEALFMLSKYDLKDYTVGTLIGQTDATTSTNYWSTSYYFVEKARFDVLFSGVNTSSDNRYRAVWNKGVNDQFGGIHCAVKKYWYADDASDLQTLHKVIPMLRMSEIYLAAVETAPSLSEANELYNTYMRSHDVLLLEDAFADAAALQKELVNEYRREFFAEGQMFFTYKRLNASEILWKSGAASENDYVLPLPNTEYNPD